MTGRPEDEQTNKDFVIEEVTDLDAVWPELEPLLLGIIAYHRPWDQRTLRPNWAQIMQEYMATRCTTLLARSASGEVTGFLSGTIRGDFGIFDGVEGHIDNAFVIEPARGGGIGRALFQRFEAICRDQGATEIRLDVAVGNELGDSFWSANGFAPTMRQMQKQLEVPA